jgi:pimeloyl-ACP methyl ester carboxylesterase
MILLIIILIIVFAVVLILFTKDLFAAYGKVNALQSKIYKSKYGDIEYILKGKGSAVLISHGVTGGIDQGIGLSETYMHKEYRFLYVSRFGYLKSQMPSNPSPKIQAAAYKELLDFLGIDKIYIFGNSAGGISAIHFAIDYPKRCKGLILLSSVVPDNNKALPPKPLMKIVF